MKNKIIAQIGIFPVLSENYTTDFPTGTIILKHGEHKRFGCGFGVVHILAEHTADLSKYGLSHDEIGVIAYIRLIIKSGAKIYSEFNNLRGNHRPMIIHSLIGTVILEKQIINGVVHYSVVSAFGRKNAYGHQIGIIP